MEFKKNKYDDYDIWQGNRIVGYIREQDSGFWLYEQRDENTIQELEEIKDFMETLK